MRCGSLFLLRRRRWRFHSQRLYTQLAPDFSLKPGGNVFVLSQELFHILASLANAFAFIAEPCAGFLHDLLGYAQIQQITFAGNAFSINNVELSFTEGSGGLVLDDLDLGPVANDGITVF